VQALLKLDRIDEIRRLLRSALTKTSTEAKRADTDVANSEDGIRRHLDLTALLATEVTTVVNKHRAILGLDPLASDPGYGSQRRSDGIPGGDGIRQGIGAPRH
jgi:hypothetical protein